MGWINVRWGVLQVLDASTSLLYEVALALNKVVEQICVSLFPVQFTIKGAPIMLSLEAPSDFVTTSWGIQVCEKNELENSDKEYVKKNMFTPQKHLK